jgi:hypothetical protein
LGRAQYRGANKIINIKVLAQLKEILKKEDGSKTENKFLIIVKIFYILRSHGLWRPQELEGF